eukprot:5111116-Amphidinium_carterae.8
MAARVADIESRDLDAEGGEQPIVADSEQISNALRTSTLQDRVKVTMVSKRQNPLMVQKEAQGQQMQEHDLKPTKPYLAKMKGEKEQGPHRSGYSMKSGVDEVDITKLTKQQVHAFDEAKMKEVNSVISESQALAPLSVEKSREMLKRFPDRVVRSRFHYPMKPKDSEERISYVHKVRCVLLGLEDPDVHDMPNSSPTPALQTLNIVLAVIAGRKWKATQLDFACAA